MFIMSELKHRNFKIPRDLDAAVARVAKDNYVSYTQVVITSLHDFILKLGEADNEVNKE